MPKRILLTGARGFIGRACVPALLNRGYDVHAVGQGSAPPSAASVRYHRCDILDRRAMAELMRAVAPTHLLHCAWNVTHGVYWTAPDNLDWLCASISLLQEFAAVGGKRAVGVGS